MWKDIEDLSDYLPRVSEATYEDSGSYNIVEYWDVWEDFKREDND